ncbi:hypothetical protein BU25DRAFT_492779 [Macroventuria anomochaeta]|uniref:Uncharacterized protein n=1 Tax=Macroventuria anomochaeta TaxID=301207 RepID=A0ACB6RWI3_9PLEO|nr:uncharacterized protein BU25DRAFT_492779 [Macroventuria anomochaeta]KAF2625499.1 hypothetical protein BU25DRAFT_492779 [Macroventuria anomochaeta]
MSVPRVISQGRLALSRGFTTQRATGSILCVVSTAAPRRQFSSSVRIREEVVQTPATGPEVPLTATRTASSGNHAQSIAITKLPWDTVPADIEQLLRNAGVDVKRIQFRIDRFTFRCDTSSFIELGSQEQAQNAIKVLNGQQLHGRSLVVRPLNDKFYWDHGFKKEHRFFFHDENTPFQAIQGLLQGRRFRLYVENPGWLNQKDEGKSINATRREIIDKHFGPFGVEAIGALNPVWKGDKQSDSSFLTHIDFASKEGAERAIDSLNDKVIEGRRVQLKPHTVSPRRAEQIGKVDRNLLAQLQQLGLLSTKESLDKVGV